MVIFNMVDDEATKAAYEYLVRLGVGRRPAAEHHTTCAYAAWMAAYCPTGSATEHPREQSLQLLQAFDHVDALQQHSPEQISFLFNTGFNIAEGEIRRMQPLFYFAPFQRCTHCSARLWAQAVCARECLPFPAPH